MRLFLLALSLGGVTGIYVKRYLEMTRGVKIQEYLRRLMKRFFKVPSKHAILAKKTAEADQEASVEIEEVDLKVQEINPGDFEKADQIFHRADYLISRGEIDEAKRLLIQSLSLNANHEGANHKLGTLYIHEQNYSKAELIYQLLTKLFPTNPKYFSHLAITFYHQTKLEEARDSYEKAIEIEPERPSRYVSLARIYEEMGDKVYAVRYFQKAREIEPRNIESLLAFAEYYIREQDFEAARILLEEVLRLSPRNEYANTLIKNSYFTS